MAEEKQKSFGIILKDSKTKKQKEERKLYTIVSCCVSVIFLITIFVPFLTNGEEKSSGKAYKNIAFDLADLEVDDEAERTLLEMNRYKDIPQQNLSGSLFTKKQKEERQQVDKVKGVPPAADKEYLQARKTKKKKQVKGVKRPATTYTQRNSTKTSTGNMSKSGMVSVSGGSSGVSGSIWTSPDKAGQNGGKNAKNGNIGSYGSQQLVASANPKGRISSLTRAVQESQRAADSNNSDVARQAVVDAFTDNNIEAEDGELEGEVEDLAEKFNPEELKKLGNDKDLLDFKNDLDDAKDDAVANSDPCAEMKNKMSFQCFWGPALMDLVKAVGIAAINYGFKSIGSGSGNSTSTSLGDGSNGWAGLGDGETLPDNVI